jgi:hypothetical protein
MPRPVQAALCGPSSGSRGIVVLAIETHISLLLLVSGVPPADLWTAAFRYEIEHGFLRRPLVPESYGQTRIHETQQWIVGVRVLPRQPKLRVNVVMPDLAKVVD